MEDEYGFMMMPLMQQYDECTGQSTERLKRITSRVNATSKADFVKRLKDRNRETLPVGDGSVMTHLLGYATDDYGNAIVFPNVQTTPSGESIAEYPYPISLERAINNGDTLMMSVPDAELFTTRYKEAYPQFNQYADGGQLSYNEGGIDNYVIDESAPEYPEYDFSGLQTASGREANSEYLNYIYKKLREAGYDDNQTAEILGQIAESSGGDPYAISNDGTAQGLLQWGPDNYSINTFYDEDPYSEINRQLKYFLSSEGNTYKDGGFVGDDTKKSVLFPSAGSQIYDIIASKPVREFYAGGDTDGLHPLSKSERQYPADTTGTAQMVQDMEKAKNAYLAAESNESLSDAAREDARYAYESAAAQLTNATIKAHPALLSVAYNWPGVYSMEDANKYLHNHPIMEITDSVSEPMQWMTSYVNSEGFNRVLANQDKWWQQRHPRKKLVFGSGANKVREAMRGKDASDMQAFLLDVTPDEVGGTYYFPAKAAVIEQPWENSTNMDIERSNDDVVFPVTVGHEVAHYFIPNYSKMAGLRGQKEALDINTGYEVNGHDEEYSERNADALSLKYLLYKIGIYDARGSEDVTEDQIRKLRERFPNIRIFKQMKSDADIAKMLNLVASASLQEHNPFYTEKS